MFLTLNCNTHKKKPIFAEENIDKKINKYRHEITCKLSLLKPQKHEKVR